MKRRNYTFSLRVEKNDIENLNFKIISEVPKYAFILHDKDFNKETGEIVEPHWHYYIEFTNPRDIKSIAENFDIPVNQIQKVFSKTAILNYLTHCKQPDKYQYNVSDVFTNFDLNAESGVVDVNNEFLDLMKVRDLKMSINDYLKKYSSQISTSNFYNRLKIYEIISKKGVYQKYDSEQEK